MFRLENLFVKHKLPFNQFASLLANSRQKFRIRLVRIEQILQEFLGNLLDGFRRIETRLRHGPLHVIEGLILLDIGVEEKFVFERHGGFDDGG